MVFVETSEGSGIYQGTLDLAVATGEGAESALKFLCQKSYDAHYGPKDNGTEIEAPGVYDVEKYDGQGNNDHKFKIRLSGKYNMTLDTKANKLYIVPQEISVKAQIEMGAL